jgi:predicted permease
MTTLRQDLRYALRWLTKNPGFTAVAIATLALGIGANTAIFSVVRGILLRPLPYTEPERIVQVWETSERQGQLREEIPFAPPVFRDWRDQNRTMEAMAAYSDWTFNSSGGETPERLRAALVSADFFKLLGVRPLIGRTFAAGEDAAGKDAFAVIASNLWTRRFGRDPRVVGSAITLDGASFTIIGVVPAGLPLYNLDPGTEVFVPNSRGFALDNRQGHYLALIGRLRPGVTLQTARADFAAMAARLEREHPESDKGFGARLLPAQEQMVGSVRPALYALLGAVVVVLLIAAGNVANMLLARASSREREIAVRAALGAGRGRLLRQLLTESVLLSLGGCVAGVLLALWGVDLLKVMAPSDIPRLAEVRLDLPVALFAVGSALLTGLAFGLAPAWQVTRTALSEMLRDRSSASQRGGGRVRRILVGAEIALSLVLVVGAALLVQSFSRLKHAHLGFETHDVFTFSLDLPEARYEKDTDVLAFHDRLLEKVRALPGVEDVASITGLPLTQERTMNLAFRIEGRPTEPGKVMSAFYNSVSPDFFSLLRIPILRGRGFTGADAPGTPRVIVISEAMANTFFPGEDPIGKRITLGGKDPKPEDWATIVGIAAGTRDTSPDRAPGPQMYMPFAQRPIGGIAALVRTRRDSRSLSSEIRAAVVALDSEQPVHSLRTMDTVVANSLGQPRFRTFLLTLFGFVAMALASIGIYGVMAYTVAQRTQEIGIRMALGAARVDVLRLVLREVVGLTGIAIAAGVAGAFVASRSLESLLYGVRPADPATYAGVAALLFGVALLAASLPARRATRIDPTTALRQE